MPNLDSLKNKFLDAHREFARLDDKHTQAREHRDAADRDVKTALQDAKRCTQPHEHARAKASLEGAQRVATKARKAWGEVNKAAINAARRAGDAEKALTNAVYAAGARVRTREAKAGSVDGIRNGTVAANAIVTITGRTVAP